LLVLECVPSHLASDISAKLDIPVIGIGAGAGTDAQVLVLHDMLGLSEHTARFVENFMSGQGTIQGALKAFVDAVKSGDYPREEHTYS
jgi:3-methyl-2-oxobutanoate hydroxymethyltransferase